MAGCLICDSPVHDEGQESRLRYYVCPRCGNWDLPGGGPSISHLHGKLGDWDARSINLRSRLSHIVRRQQRSDGGWVRVPLDQIESWQLDSLLPRPSEQLDQLIIWIGERQPSYAESALLDVPAASAWIGSAITRRSPGAGVGWLLEQQADRLILKHGEERGAPLLRLTISGWDRFEEMRRGRVASRTVLMAMKFGDDELTRVVDQCFRPAVKRTGFELRTLADNQPTGLIDDQLRVALRTSRFIISDLTHGNNGAYWEAGFAEGLGHPVLYTCREAEWNAQKSHFDTNHMNTIIWNVSKLDVAAERIAATIRATLPEEAKMEDG
jgi:hypothetical protein